MTKNITGKELVIKVLKDTDEPMSCSDIFDTSKKSGYLKLYARGTDKDQKKAQISSLLSTWCLNDDCPVTRYDKGYDGNSVYTYILNENVELTNNNIEIQNNRNNNYIMPDRKKVTTRAKLPSSEAITWVELLRRYNLPHKNGAAASVEWIKYKNNDTKGLLPDVEVVDLNGNIANSLPKRPLIGSTKRSEIWIIYFPNSLTGICPCCKDVYDREIRFNCHELGHNKPHSKGGSSEFNNLIPICKECNDGMDNKYTIVEYRKILLSRKRIIE